MTKKDRWRTLLRRAKPLLQALKNGSTEHELVLHHRLGSLINDLVSHRGVYGTHQNDEVSEVLRLNPQRVYRLREFARRYALTRVKSLVRSAPKLSFAHITVLLSITNQPERRRFEQRLVKFSWTATELRRAVRERFGARRAGGRPLKVRSAAEAIGEMKERLNALNAFWNEHQAVILAAAKSGRGDKSAQRLRELSATLQQLAKATRL